MYISICVCVLFNVLDSTCVYIYLCQNLSAFLDLFLNIFSIFSICVFVFVLFLCLFLCFSLYLYLLFCFCCVFVYMQNLNLCVCCVCVHVLLWVCFWFCVCVFSCVLYLNVYPCILNVFIYVTLVVCVYGRLFTSENVILRVLMCIGFKINGRVCFWLEVCKRFFVRLCLFLIVVVFFSPLICLHIYVCVCFYVDICVAMYVFSPALSFCSCGWLYTSVDVYLYIWILGPLYVHVWWLICF